MRVLIVEDEVRLGETLRDLLVRERCTADICRDGESGLDCALSDIYDLIILDVMLPKQDGFSLLRALRQAGRTVPVLMLTARGELADRVAGLEGGADYYLTKPFEPRELVACVRMLSRRRGESRPTGELSYLGLRLEPHSMTLWWEGRSVRLSRKEYDLCELFLRSRQGVLSKEQILLKLWGYDSDAEDNNAEVYISFLRRKLAHLGAQVRIRTIRTVGYCLEPAEDAAGRS